MDAVPKAVYAYGITVCEIVNLGGNSIDRMPAIREDIEETQKDRKIGQADRGTSGASDVILRASREAMAR